MANPRDAPAPESKDAGSARNLAIFLKQRARQHLQPIEALANNEHFVCKDWRTFQEARDGRPKTTEKVVPIHHQNPERATGTAFNQSFHKAAASQESSFSKSFSRKRVFENSAQVKEDGERKTPSLKSLMRSREAHFQQKFAHVLKASEGADDNEVVFQAVEAPQIFSRELDESLQYHEDKPERHGRMPSHEQPVSTLPPNPGNQLFKLNIGGGITIDDLKDPRIKDRIVNSLRYRVQHRVSNHEDYNMYQAVDFPDDIREEIAEFLDVTLPKMMKLPVYEVVRRGKVERRPDQTQQMIQYLRRCSAHFKVQDADLLRQVIDKVSAGAYAPGETILAHGKEDDKVAILLEGQAVLKRHGVQIAQAVPDTIINEDLIFGGLAGRKGTVLAGRKKVQHDDAGPRKERDFALVAGDEACKVLFLSKTNFSLAEKYYHMEKVRTCEKLLKRVPIMQEWSMVKRMGFSESLRKRTYESGERVYGLSEKVDDVFFIQDGVVQIEVFYIINYSVTYPTAKTSYSRKTNSRVVRRALRKIGPGQAFGFEEVVLQKPHRVFQARVVGGKPATIVCSTKENFTATVTAADVKQYRAACSTYSDFQKEGHDLVREMDSYKQIVEIFQDAAGSNEAKMPNFRSQDSNYSWLGPRQWGLKAQKREQYLIQYSKHIKQERSRSKDRGVGKVAMQMQDLTLESQPGNESSRSVNMSSLSPPSRR